MDVKVLVSFGLVVRLGWFYNKIPEKLDLIKFKFACLSQRQCHKTKLQMETLFSNPEALKEESVESKLFSSLNLWA